MRYPRWRDRWANIEADTGIPVGRRTDDGQPVPGPFCTVFACRSGGWVPAWCDDQWQEFIDAFPGQIRSVDPDLRPRWAHPVPTAVSAHRTATRSTHR